MTTDTDKLVETAVAAGGMQLTSGNVALSPEELAAFRAAIIASLCGDVEPVALMWQHDETGRTGFVEHAHAEELEQWERINRPRRFVAKLYPASTVAALKAERDAALARVAVLEKDAATLKANALATPEEHTHRCVDCLWVYTPSGQVEDCPACGSDGRAALTKGQPAPQPQQEQSNG